MTDDRKLFPLRMTEEERERIQAAAESARQSMNEWILTAIDKRMKEETMNARPTPTSDLFDVIDVSEEEAREVFASRGTPERMIVSCEPRPGVFGWHNAAAAGDYYFGGTNFAGRKMADPSLDALQVRDTLRISKVRMFYRKS